MYVFQRSILVNKEEAIKVGYSLIDNKFNIIEALGTGSTSSVYKVSNKNLPDEYFALKILHPSLVRDDTLAKRFQRELLASHTVNHPNIVRGFDFGNYPTVRSVLFSLNVRF